METVQFRCFLPYSVSYCKASVGKSKVSGRYFKALLACIISKAEYHLKRVSEVTQGVGVISRMNLWRLLTHDNSFLYQLRSAVSGSDLNVRNVWRKHPRLKNNNYVLIARCSDFSISVLQCLQALNSTASDWCWSPFSCPINLPPMFTQTQLNATDRCKMNSASKGHWRWSIWNKIDHRLWDSYRGAQWSSTRGAVHSNGT